MLSNCKATTIDWPLEVDKVKFSSFNAVRIETIGDGSCYFHAILNAISENYRLEKINDSTITKREIVRYVRDELASRLESQDNKEEKSSANSKVKGKTIYDTLARGNLRATSKDVPEVSLQAMQASLRSNQSVSNEFQELVSNVFNVDIYMLDLQKKDVYNTIYDSTTYKERDSIVLISTFNHFELVALPSHDKKKYNTLFSPIHPFILFIKKRIQKMISFNKDNKSK